HDDVRRLIRPQYSFVVPLLPRAPYSQFRAKDIVDALLRDLDETLQIGRSARSFEYQMDVVRHVAVRKNCELILASRTKNLRVCAPYRNWIDEQSSASVGAESQGISMDSDIREAADAPRAAKGHDANLTRFVPHRFDQLRRVSCGARLIRLATRTRQGSRHR